MSEVNDRVKILRNDLGMNQSDFGKKIGIAQTYLSQIEKGDRQVTDKIFKIICLESWNGNFVNEEWLRTGNGEMFLETKKDDLISKMLGDVIKSDETNFKRRLISALSKLDDAGWDSLEKLIDDISDGKEH